MRVSVIGCGHLGIPHAAAMAELGHTVTGIDTDQVKVDLLNKGECPIYESGLPELLSKHLSSGRLSFTTNMAEARLSEVHFLAVGTPTATVGHQHDTSQLVRAVSLLAPHISAPCTVIGKSTVTVGTSHFLESLLHNRSPAGTSVETVWNPEFLREGQALQDTLHPDRIVAGVSSTRGEKAVRQVYDKIIQAGTPLFITNLVTAEMVKGAANAFLAMKISFANGISDMCKEVGADAIQLVEAIGIDSRIGSNGMMPGPGFGGGCLPKDLKAFAAAAEELNALDMADLLWSVERVNASRAEASLNLIEDALGGSVAGTRIAVLGAAFKGGTNDVRESPALALVSLLKRNGAVVRIYDPQAMSAALKEMPDLRTASTVEESVSGADVVVVATECPEFSSIDPLALLKRIARPTMVDLRNAIDSTQWRRAGWSVWQLGRALWG